MKHPVENRMTFLRGLGNNSEFRRPDDTDPA